MMKITIVALFALIAGASASAILSAPLLAHHATVPVATGFLGAYPTSRFTQTEWKQPGATIITPAVARYQTITPGFTSLHAAAAPVIAAAPIAAAPIATGHIAAPYTAQLLIR